MSYSPTFSVVMPVYNGANYVRNAIFSVVNQSYRQWELIIIDDGSTDDSYNQIETLIQAIPHVTLIRINNSGPLVARGIGIALARNDYICHLDCDDTYDSSLMETLAKTICSCSQPDIIMFGMRFVSALKTNDYCDGNPPQIVSADDFLLECLSKEGIYNSVCNKAFRREIASFSLNEATGKICYYEDLLRVVPCVCNAKSVVLLDQALYNYNLAHSSHITGKASYQNAVDILRAKCFLYSYLASHERLPERTSVFYKSISKAFSDFVTALILYCPQNLAFELRDNLKLYESVLWPNVNCVASPSATLKYWLIRHHLFWLLSFLVHIKAIFSENKPV